MQFTKSLSLLGVFMSVLFFAQNTRFVYMVSMKTDSTHKNEAKRELAHLDISSGKSVFYGEMRLKRDSVIQRMRSTGSFDREQMQNLRSDIDYIIEKEPVNRTITFKNRLMRDQYAYEEDRAMLWKILPETMKIGDYQTQKAETQFAGRTWVAWFAEEIPFQDGPYKFAGLPGLIVKVEDDKGDYSFNLVKTKKIDTVPTFEQRGNTLKVKRSDYEKQLALFRKDPIAFATQSFSSGGGFGGTRGQGSGGDFRPNPDVRKQIEERLKEEVKKNNNPIELYISK